MANKKLSQAIYDSALDATPTPDDYLLGIQGNYTPSNSPQTFRFGVQNIVDLSTIPDATTTVKGKALLGAAGGAATFEALATEVSRATAAESANTSLANSVRTAKVTVGNTNADFTVASGTDASTTFTNAIAALTSGRTWVETVYIRGNFTINNFVVIPSYTHVILDGTVTTTTLRPSGATNWANNMGVFEFGSRTTYSPVLRASVEFTPGSRIEGDYFNTSAGSYPQDKSNSAFVTDATILNQKDVCAVHSYNTLMGCYTKNVYANNMHGSVRLETLGRTNGTPSKDNKVIGTKGRYVVVTVEAYVNGYQSDSLEVLDTWAEFSVDDIVAIIAADGGVSGGTAAMYGVTVDGVTGNKNGLRGSGVKLDGGAKGTGQGSITDVQVSNVNLRTLSATLTGVVPNENVTYIVNGGNTLTRNINYTNLKGSGNWRFGIRGQVLGIDLHFSNVYAEALYGASFTSSAAPSAIQKMSIINATFIERNTTSGETGSAGLSFMGGSGVQGYQNVTLRNVRLHYFASPVLEAGISGLGVSGTLTNFEYDIDIMANAIADSTYSSTNRRSTIKQFGQIAQQDNGGVKLLNVAAGTNPTDGVNKAQLDAASSITPSATPTVQGKVLQTRFNVRDYGAVGDGVANDYPAFLACSSAAIAAGYPIYAPKGVYKFNSQLNLNNDNVYILGDGAGLTRFVNNIAGNSIIQIGNASGPTIRSNIIVEGITFDLNATSQSWGMQISWCKNVIVRDCNFINPATNSFSMLYMGMFSGQDSTYPSNNFLIDNCLFDYNNVNSGWEAVTLGYSRNIRVRDCTFLNKPGTFPGLLNYASDDVLIQRNRFEKAFCTINGRGPTVFSNNIVKSGQCFIYNAHNVVVDSNSFFGTAQDAADSRPTGVKVLGNYYDNTSTEVPFYVTIPYVWSCQNIVISNNEFSGSNGEAISSKVFTKNSNTYLSASELTITGNTIQTSWTDGIHAYANYIVATDNRAYNNNQLNDGSAATNFMFGAKYGIFSNNQSYDNQTTPTISRDFTINNQYVAQIPAQKWLLANNDLGVTSATHFFNGGYGTTQLGNVTINPITGSPYETNVLLGGRSGGQTVKGGTAASENLTLTSTLNATKGKVIIGTSAYDETNNRLGVGTATPSTALQVVGTATATTFAGSGASLTSIPETAVTNLVTDLAAKATDTLVVHLAGTETISGPKTFSVPLNITAAANAGDPALRNQEVITSTEAYSTQPGAGIIFRNQYNSSNAVAGMGGIAVYKENATDGDFAAYLGLYTRNNGGSVSERFRITSGGLVGIGKTPTTPLDVNGIAQATEFDLNGTSSAFSTAKDFIGSFAAGNVDINARGSIRGYLDANNNGTTDKFSLYNDTASNEVFSVAGDGGLTKIGGSGLATSTLQVAGSFAGTNIPKSAAFGFAATDMSILANATTAAFSGTLPTAVGIQGRRYYMVKTDASANAVTFATTSGQTIGYPGATTLALTTQGKYGEVESDGANWFIRANN